jgi:hypothetical protein
LTSPSLRRKCHTRAGEHAGKKGWSNANE